MCQREGGGVQRAYFALNLIYILRSEGSYTDSSESQSGLCILLPLAKRRMRRKRRKRGDFSPDEEPLQQTRSSIRKSSQST